LIIDTDFHIGIQGSQHFHEIYEEFKAGQAPTNQKERKLWERVRRSGLPLVAARLAMLSYTYMVSWVLDQIERGGHVLKKDASALISCSALSYQMMYKLPVAEENADENFMRTFSVKHESLEEWLK